MIVHLTGYSANGNFYLCNGYEFSQATNSGVRNGTSLFSLFNGNLISILPGSAAEI